MFPAPPFSMFRYAIWEVRPMPGTVHVPHFRCSDPGMDSDDINEYSLEELDVSLNKDDIVSLAPQGATDR